VLERIARSAEVGPVTKIDALPLKGCGWSIGETIYGEMRFTGTVKTTFLMCRNRSGVRFDLTTYESRWVRGARS
jgi:hypothetical protein